MPTLLDLTTQLVGEIPGLPRLFAAKYINKALQEVRRAKLWSWNIGEGVLITPSAVSTGTCTTTLGSNVVTFDATAQAALLPLVFANPPLVSRQFRTGGTGSIYNIISYDGAGTMTLDRIYGETSAGGAIYSIYKCYYGPPSSDGVTPNNDFLRHLSITNPLQGYTIRGKRLYMTGPDLNQRDPLRGALGYPYYMATYQPTPIPTPPNNVTGTAYNQPTYGQMQYEAWPHPTFQMELKCLYERLHVDMQPSDYIPAQCPDTLITYKANEYAYRWAATNSARVPELKGINWMTLLLESQKRYRQALVDAKRVDNEVQVIIIKPGATGMYALNGPIDSNFSQSHDYPILGW